jgi:hypothetical protein
MDKFVQQNLHPGRTPAEIHASICALTAAQAKLDPAWATFSACFLSATVQAAITALVEDGPPESATNKRKATDQDLQGGDVGPHCRECGWAVPQIAITVACVDGAKHSIIVPQRARTSEVKQTLARVCDIGVGTIELFKHGVENALPDEERLDSLDVEHAAVLFMLLRETRGWCWTTCTECIALSKEGRVAAVVTDTGENYHLVTGGEPMLRGRHYWEVEITEVGVENGGVVSAFFGAVRPGLDHHSDYATAAEDGAYFLYGYNGSLYGHGKEDDERQLEGTELAEGDRVGVLLDLDRGALLFFRNGESYGPGFTSGVCGPLVRAMEVGCPGNVMTALPDATLPGPLGTS